MLNYFRHCSFRKSLWLIVLLGSIVTQTQSLFACDLMDNGPQTSCCCDENMDKGCDMGGGCSTSDTGLLSGCCQTSLVIDSGLQDVVLGDSHAAKILSLDTPQFAPIFILINDLFVPITEIKSTVAISKDLNLPEATTGRFTYRTTNRFRI